VIVHDLHIGSSLSCPDKAQSPLIIDAYAVLALPVALERFETVPGWNLQVFENCGPVELRKLPEGRTLNADPASYSATFEEGLRVLALEALDRHGMYNINAPRS
jgi:hypothetical protein